MAFLTSLQLLKVMIQVIEKLVSLLLERVSFLPNGIE
jgi:hypothetical protein